jgi:hypothetical protein
MNAEPMRKLALAAILLALAGSTYAVAMDSDPRHGHVRHAGAKPANPSDAPSATPEPSDQRDPEDLALDRKIKSICRGC